MLLRLTNFEQLKESLAKIIIGQEKVIEHLAICLFSQGHALLMGVPGLAKTLLVSRFAESMALLKQLIAKVELPAYLQHQEPLNVDVRGGIVRVLKGSTTALEATTIQELAEATLNDVPQQVTGASLITEAILLNTPTEMRLTWQDRFGLSAREPQMLRFKESNRDAARFPAVSRKTEVKLMAYPPKDTIPFEVFASFKRIETGNPIISLPPPRWAAATHAIIVDDTLHYIWCKREPDIRWVMMHATAPISAPTDITQDSRNPILEPSVDGFDSTAVEYPFPFLNPADGKFYMYYRGKGKTTPEQTGLLVSNGDLGEWRRVQRTPVIPADTEHERYGSTHPSVAVVGNTIHIVYTGKATRSFADGLTMCHATAPTENPASVTKNTTNPVFRGSGQAWDRQAVRETELFKEPHYFHILYGGYDGKVWRIGHVRTRDFRTFEPNPYNPVFTPSEDPDAFDCDGVLTGQIFEIGGTYAMLYAGKKGQEWQTGLATMQEV